MRARTIRKARQLGRSSHLSRGVRSESGVSATANAENDARTRSRPIPRSRRPMPSRNELQLAQPAPGVPRQRAVRRTSGDKIAADESEHGRHQGERVESGYSRRRLLEKSGIRAVGVLGGTLWATAPGQPTHGERVNSKGWGAKSFPGVMVGAARYGRNNRPTRSISPAGRRNRRRPPPLRCMRSLSSACASIAAP